MTNSYNNLYHVAPDDADASPVQTGKQRVMRLLIIALFFVVIVGVIVFVLIPYIDLLNPPTAPPLPPAIQT